MKRRRATSMKWWIMGWHYTETRREVAYLDSADDLTEAQVIASTIAGAWVDGPHENVRAVQEAAWPALGPHGEVLPSVSAPRTTSSEREG